MAANQSSTENLQKAKANLQALASQLTPDLQLLSALQEDIAKAINAGATVKQVWRSLRDAGFVGNQMKLSNWLEEKEIRKKLKKEGAGKRKNTGAQSSKQSEAQPGEATQSDQPVQSSGKQEKTESKAAEKPAVKPNSDFPIEEDEY